MQMTTVQYYQLSCSVFCTHRYPNLGYYNFEQSGLGFTHHVYYLEITMTNLHHFDSYVTH